MSDRVAIATETLAIVEQGHYTAASGRRVELRDAVDAALAGTRLYTPSELAALVSRAARPPCRVRIEVTPEGTAEAGQRLVREGEARVAVLNFASARNVGGGFLNGARAQEEELCRASALYPCLERVPAYYEANRHERSALYTDHAIWSPRVPFFRGADRQLVEEPYLLGVITSPAPNTGAVRHNQPDALSAVPEVFARRAGTVLAIAEDQGCDALVLGAWGCGAFQGDPAVAADAFARALEGRFAGSFRRVVFAVLVAGERDQANLDAFRARFSSR